MAIWDALNLTTVSTFITTKANNNILLADTTMERNDMLSPADKIINLLCLEPSK